MAANSRRIILRKDRTMSALPIPGPAPVYEDYARCIHCGLCLNACPTYRLWNLEADSPRGRIHQMIHVELDQQPITDSFVDHIDKCLDCRACETACPSGVEYGKLVEHARARIERDYPRSWFARAARNFIFRHFLSEPSRLSDAARIVPLSTFRAASHRARHRHPKASRTRRTRTSSPA